jgi:hypothetical protein
MNMLECTYMSALHATRTIGTHGAKRAVGVPELQGSSCTAHLEPPMHPCPGPVSLEQWLPCRSRPSSGRGHEQLCSADSIWCGGIPCMQGIDGTNASAQPLGSSCCSHSAAWFAYHATSNSGNPSANAPRLCHGCLDTASAGLSNPSPVCSSPGALPLA